MKHVFVVGLCGLLLFGLLFFGVAGCKKSKFVKTEYVEGVVKLDGEIVPEGTNVYFHSTKEGGLPAHGKTDANGVYKLTSADGASEKGAVEGDYKIVVSRVENTIYQEGDPKAPRNSYGNLLTAVGKETMPQQYSTLAKTPLTYTVVPGKQTHDIDLVSK